MICQTWRTENDYGIVVSSSLGNLMRPNLPVFYQTHHHLGKPLVAIDRPALPLSLCGYPAGAQWN
eukprot:scaffold1669_cov129-Cylindrotheca_fusiformis.AAC.26